MQRKRRVAYPPYKTVRSGAKDSDAPSALPMQRKRRVAYPPYKSQVFHREGPVVDRILLGYNTPVSKTRDPWFDDLCQVLREEEGNRHGQMGVSGCQDQLR